MIGIFLISLGLYRIKFEFSIFEGMVDLQAVILAAGLGRRLGKYTKNVPKCMVEVNGKPLIEHALSALKGKVSRVVIVIGYKGEKVREFLGNSFEGLKIDYVDNPLYETTNNIYSLWLASEEMMKDDTILLESDIIFEKSIIDDLLNSKGEAVAVVDRYEDWMDGTVVMINDEDYITSFIDASHFDWSLSSQYYKTVNIYKFSKEFFKKHYYPFLKAYIESSGYSSYYEVVLSIITGLRNIKIKALPVKEKKWYEIDTPEDLWTANLIFAPIEEKYELLKKSYGGYWRFPKLKDFCYLVNPYFPPSALLERMKVNFKSLIESYPSGRERIKVLLSQVFGVDSSLITAGNGASELIKILLDLIGGKIGIVVPTFEEYPNRASELIVEQAPPPDFRYTEELVFKLLESSDVVVLVNPDNPSGNFLEKERVMKILGKAKEEEKRIIIDESFVDFVDPDFRFTLIDEDILKSYPNLVVIKSISKSFGVPGLRLGILASADHKLLESVEKALPIWNTNSFAEYFLQKLPSHMGSYWKACDRIAKEREWMIERLKEINGIEPMPSQANFIMCRVEDSRKVTLELLKRDFFIKDCYGKMGIPSRNYIRISVKSREENEQILKALKEVFLKKS